VYGNAIHCAAIFVALLGGAGCSSPPPTPQAATQPTASDRIADELKLARLEKDLAAVELRWEEVEAKEDADLKSSRKNTASGLN